MQQVRFYGNSKTGKEHRRITRACDPSDIPQAKRSSPCDGTIMRLNLVGF